jgi:hypothetical protein
MIIAGESRVSRLSHNAIKETGDEVVICESITIVREDPMG